MHSSELYAQVICIIYFSRTLNVNFIFWSRNQTMKKKVEMRILWSECTAGCEDILEVQRSKEIAAASHHCLPSSMAVAFRFPVCKCALTLQSAQVYSSQVRACMQTLRIHFYYKVPDLACLWICVPLCFLSSFQLFSDKLLGHIWYSLWGLS